MNLVRMGSGEWTIIEEDYLLPHNLARNALFGYSVGCSKGEELARIANQMVMGKPIATAIVADVLSPGKVAGEVHAALIRADILLDVSTSVAVARYLARDVASQSRRISLFLNPSGTDLVMLAEGTGRETMLDFLEMQYYRQLINDPTLRTHLSQHHTPVRYAQSCRDVSSSIRQDIVALHAAIASRALHIVVACTDASVAIWQTDNTMLDVQRKKINVDQMIEQRFGDWTLCLDQWLLDKIWQLRGEKLPNETGGVLIGSFDMQRKIIYVVDTIPSPPDSTEWPTLYIRGYQGLTQRVKDFEDITQGMLRYVGEWHSHPQGCNCNPSKDDRKAFDWLAENMMLDELPALMAIAGDDRQYAWYLNRIP